MDKSRPCSSGAPGSEGQQLRSASVAPAAGECEPEGEQAIMSDRKAVIKNADMSEEMQQDSVECAILAIGEYNVERETVALMKSVNV
ncbi:dynein light chain 2, cytoplasmic-like [Morphnus guianensis]